MLTTLTPFELYTQALAVNRREIFVFGSNEAGRHGKGSALYARKHFGAIYGQGEGLQGLSYGIPTKDKNLRVLSLDVIANNVCTFLDFALSHPEMDFRITPIGCGYAGYKRHQIRPMFEGYSPLPRNCFYSVEWNDPDAI